MLFTKLVKDTDALLLAVAVAINSTAEETPSVDLIVAASASSKRVLANDVKGVTA